MSFLDPLAWNWPVIFSTFVSAGAGTAFFSWIKERGQANRRASFLALETAMVLERFAGECVGLIYENRYAEHRPDEQFPDWNPTLPTLQELSADQESWRLLPNYLAAPIRSLPDRISESREIIGSVIEHHEEDLDVYIPQEAALRGLDALDAALLLRRRYRLPNRLTGLGNEDALLSALLRSRAERAQREARSQKMWESMLEMSAERDHSAARG